MSNNMEWTERGGSAMVGILNGHCGRVFEWNHVYSIPWVGGSETRVECELHEHKALRFGLHKPARPCIDLVSRWRWKELQEPFSARLILVHSLHCEIASHR